MLLVAVVSPVLGASADYSGRRKRFLFSFTLLSVVATALLSFAGPGMAVFAVLLFIMANIGFEGGLVFYDAYLKEITSEKSIGRLSGYGFAMGYLGALCILLLLRPLLEGGISACECFQCSVEFSFFSCFFCPVCCPNFSGIPR